MKYLLLWSMALLVAPSLAAGDEKPTPAQTNFMRALEMKIEAAQLKAQTSGIPPEGMGFFPPQSTRIPVQIRRAAASVFRIALPAGEFVSIKAMFHGMALAEVAKTFEADPNIDEASRAILLFQLRACGVKSEDCWMWDSVEFGSGFVTGDGRELRTALHIVSPVLKKNPNALIPLFIFGPNDSVLYNPATLKAQLVAMADHAIERTMDDGREFDNFDLDQAVVHLDQFLAPGLAIAEHTLEEGEQAYLISVPHQTHDRAAYRAPDANGKSVLVSLGTALGARTLTERYKMVGLSLDEAAATRQLSHGVATTADSAPGSSGGAILNKAGEVVSVYNNGMTASGTAFPFHTSYGSKSLLQMPR